MINQIGIGRLLEVLEEVKNEYLPIVKQEYEKKAVDEHISHLLKIFINKQIGDYGVKAIVPIFFSIDNWDDWGLSRKESYKVYVVGKSNDYLTRFLCEACLAEKSNKSFSDTIIKSLNERNSDLEDGEDKRRRKTIIIKKSDCFYCGDEYEYIVGCMADNEKKYDLCVIKGDLVDEINRYMGIRGYSDYENDGSMEIFNAGMLSEFKGKYLDKIDKIYDRVSKISKKIDGYEDLHIPIINHAPYLDDNHYIVYVISNTVDDKGAGKGLGGVYFLIDKRIINVDNDISGVIKIFEDIVERLSIRIIHAYDYEQKNRHALRAAIGSIMARNMSHNLGSHILAKLVDIDDTEEAIRFFGYIKERMDFIADITTSSLPSVEMSAVFYKDIMCKIKPSNSDCDLVRYVKYVCEFISGIDLLRDDNIDIRYMRNGNEIILGDDRNDPAIALPSGVLGGNAIYIIIENIIRNTAKHSFLKSKSDRVNFSLELSEDDEASLYKVDIFDDVNMLECAEKIKEMNGMIKDYILNNGVVRNYGWGVIEMKVCAGYLRGINLEGIDDDVNPPLIQAISRDVNGQRNMGYRIYLQKPREIMIINGGKEFKRVDNKALMNYGVRLVQEKNEIGDVLAGSIKYNMLLLVGCEDYEDMLKNRRTLYPIIFLEEHKNEINIEKIKTFLKRQDFLGLKVYLLNKYIGCQDYVLYMRNNVMGDKSGCVEWSQEDKVPGGIKKYVIYDRHSEMCRTDKRDISKEAIDKMWTLCDRGDSVVYYEGYDYAKNPISFVLEGEKIKDDKGLHMELILSGIINVYVIDERIQDVIQKRKRKDLNFEKKLRMMNIHVMDKNEVDFDDPYKYISWFVEEYDNSLIKKIKKDDFIVIHLGVLEKIYGTKVGSIELMIRIIAAYESKGGNVVIISGRGTPDSVKKMGVRFMNYSSVSRYIIESQDKYNLIKVLLSSRISK